MTVIYPVPHTIGSANNNKKLYYRRRTARRDVSVKILPTAAHQCRNNLYKDLFLYIYDLRVHLTGLSASSSSRLRLFASILIKAVLTKCTWTTWSAVVELLVIIRTANSMRNRVYETVIVTYPLCTCD